MSPAWNPLHGDIPVATYRPGGAIPSADDGASSTAVLGGIVDGLPKMTTTPSTVAGLVILSAAVILGIHFLGVRTHFTVSAGG